MTQEKNKKLFDVKNTTKWEDVWWKAVAPAARNGIAIPYEGSINVYMRQILQFCLNMLPCCCCLATKSSPTLLWPHGPYIA